MLKISLLVICIYIPERFLYKEMFIFLFYGKMIKPKLFKDIYHYICI